MGNDHSTVAVFPSLEAFKKAKGARPGAPVPQDDPLKKFEEAFGLWATGGIRDYPRPLPVLVEVREKLRARALAKQGGRPLEAADQELQDMVVAHFAEEKKDGDGKEIPLPPLLPASFIAKIEAARKGAKAPKDEKKAA